MYVHERAHVYVRVCLVSYFMSGPSLSPSRTDGPAIVWQAPLCSPASLVLAVKP